MLNYVVERSCELCNFPAWAGGSDVLHKLCQHAAAYDVIEGWLTDYLNELSQGEVTDYLINDILWFKVDDILAEYGFNLNTYEKKALYE